MFYVYIEVHFFIFFFFFIYNKFSEFVQTLFHCCRFIKLKAKKVNPNLYLHIHKYGSVKILFIKNVL